MERIGQFLVGAAQWVYQGAVWWSIPIVVILLFPSPLVVLGYIGGLVLFVCRWVVEGAFLPRSRAAVPLFLFLVMIVVGFVISPNYELSMATIDQVVASLLIFLVVFDKTNSVADLERAAAVLAFLGILLALIAPFTVNWSPNKLFGVPAFYDASWPRLPKLTNSNILAGALAPIVPMSLALVMLSEKRWRAVGAISFAPLTIILVLLQSRGALFALAFGLAIWITLYRRWVLPLIPLGLITFLYINTQQGWSSPAQLIYGAPGTAGVGTFIARQDLWIQALYLIRQSPLVGIGLNAYPQVGPVSFPYAPEHPGSIYPHAHNLFLQVALDTGTIGLASFVVLMVLAMRIAWQAYNNHFERHLAIGLFSAFVVVIVHGLGDVIVWGPSKSSVVLWILLGIAFAFDKVRKTV